MNTPVVALLRGLGLRARAWLRGAGLGLLTALTGVALAVVACGGGGGSSVAGVGSGGTGSFSVGTVTGFGSVYVNGLRYDDASASVSDDDGARSRSDLKLGMVVRVQGSTSASGDSSASSISFDSALLGPVSGASAAGKTFTIIGQKVVVAAGTVFDPTLPQGFASIQTGQTLEVHGFVNPLTNELQATLVEVKPSPSYYKISGQVNNLQNGAKTFQIGSESINFAALNGNTIPQGFANGLLVKVRLDTRQPSANGAWAATRVRIDQDSFDDQDNVDIEGLITALTSPTQFQVNGVRVDASSANFPDGTADVAQGARVKIKGSIVGGTLLAKEVKLETKGKQIDLRGTISNVDGAAKTFVLRGVTVSYAGTVQYDNGTVSSVLNDASVEVKGQTAFNSSVVEASRIKFSN
jgi:Domain of unknown function (DUF5666)